MFIFEEKLMTAGWWAFLAVVALVLYVGGWHVFEPLSYRIGDPRGLEMSKLAWACKGGLIGLCFEMLPRPDTRPNPLSMPLWALVFSSAV